MLHESPRQATSQRLGVLVPAVAVARAAATRARDHIYTTVQILAAGGLCLCVYRMCSFSQRCRMCKDIRFLISLVDRAGIFFNELVPP